MKNEYWENEEFEDLVAKSLIAMYENKVHKECFRVPKFIKPNDRYLLQLRNLGAYFPPSDRCIHINSIDMINDGLPLEACWAYDPREGYQGKQKEDLIFDEYFRANYIR